jgi:hypothetical protein
MSIFSVDTSSIAKIISPATIPALLAGPSGFDDTTTKPLSVPSSALGYANDNPTPVRAALVPDCLQTK